MKDKNKLIIFELYSYGHHLLYLDYFIKYYSKSYSNLSVVSSNHTITELNRRYNNQPFFKVRRWYPNFLSKIGYWSSNKFVRYILITLLLLILIIFCKLTKSNLSVICYDYYKKQLKYISKILTLDCIDIVFLAPEDGIKNNYFLEMGKIQKFNNIYTCSSYAFDIAKNFIYFKDPIENSYRLTKKSIPEHDILLIIGSINTRKNIDEAIALAGEFPSLHIHIRGAIEDNYKSDFTKLINKNIEFLMGRLVISNKSFSLEEEIAFIDKSKYVWVNYLNHNASSGIMYRAIARNRFVIYRNGLEINKIANKYVEHCIFYDDFELKNNLPNFNNQVLEHCVI